MSKRYFYARVSTKDQSLARQLKKAKEYKNVDRVFCDKESGKDFDRKEYQEMKSILGRGDEVIVISLDRLGRDKEATKAEIAWFKENGIMLRILNLPTTLMEYPVGQEWVMDMINNILVEVLGAMAEQERENIKKRQAEGIAAMPTDKWGRRISTKPGKEGRAYGTKKEIPDNFEDILRRQREGEITVLQGCAEAGIGRSLWYKLARKLVA
jgi:DNA invertase Pin-like site-specific DNA recombinase